MTLFTVSLFMSILSLSVGGLIGWSLARQNKRKTVDRRFWFWLPLALYMILHAAILLTRLRFVGVIIPRGSGQTVDMPIYFLSNQILLSLFVGGWCCFLLLNRHKQWRAAVLAGLLLCSFSILAPYSRGTIAHTLQDRRSPDGVIMQTSGYSCAAATCANISEYFGMPATEREMAEKLGITDRGSSMAQVKYLLNSIDLRTRELRHTPPQIRNVTAPAILSIYHPITGPETHLVAYMGSRDGMHEIWDPLRGKLLLTDAELNKLWEGLTVEVSR